MNHRSHVVSLVAAAIAATLIAGALTAQNRKPAKDRPVDRVAKLKSALKSTLSTRNLSYTSHHRTVQRAGGRGQPPQKVRGGTVECSGVWDGHLLFAKVGEDDELLFHGRRMLAQDDENDWTLRRNKTAKGKDLEFVLDPSGLLTALANTTFQVTHHSVSTINGKPVETYTITLEDDHSRNLLWSGSLPTASNGGVGGGAAGVVRLFALGGGGRAVGPKVDLSIDLAISFDPSTRMIHRITGRSYDKTTNPFGGRVMVARGGGGRFRFGEEEEEEDDDDEEEERPKKGDRHEDGLPVRSKSSIKTSTVVRFGFDFKNHGTAKFPKLEPHARRMLGLPKLVR